jgi:ABC-type bacteriocin/lantibiotic exporter with double-glycine peptidase domain
MDNFFVIVIAGMAVGFSTELIGTLMERFTTFYSPVIKQILSAPFGALYCWLLGVFGWELLVFALASGFFALIIMYWINRPVQIQQVMSRRLP